jgi:branched-chain amino acid transport system permease protein
MLLQQIINGIINGSIYALVALGMTMVYGVLKIIHFAHGAVYMLGAYIALMTYQHLGNSFILSILSAVMISVLVGVLIEKIAYRPLRGSSPLSPLIASISVYFIIEDLVRNAWGAAPRQFGFVLETNTIIDLEFLVITNIQIGIFLLSCFLMVCVVIFLNFTKTGIAMRAVSLNADIASVNGINSDKIISLNFALGSAVAGVAGLIIAVYYNEVSPTMGLEAINKAFALTIMGGLGNVPGCIIAGLILGVLESIMVGYFDLPISREGMAFIVVIIILLYRPQGIFGKSIIKV